MDPKQTFERGKSFFERDIWSTRLEHKSRGRVLLYRLGRTVYATVRGFFDKELTSRAAALTYYTVLSIVPFLAFAFSLLKGFGLYQKLMKESLRPYLRETFAGDKSLLEALDQLLGFVERTDVSGLSVVGILFLVYTSIAMLSTVESSLNDIWEAKRARSLLRKVTDYTTMLVVGPLLAVAAITVSAAAQNSHFVAFLHRSLFGGLVDFFLGLTSILLVCVSLVTLYLILPNVRVRFASARFGGGGGGLLWQGALLLQVKFQIGVAKYNALYSGFAALPIFLVWLYLSWTIVLIGAQLAASHQYEQRMKQAVRARHIDQELKENLAVVVAAAVSRRFLEGRPPPTAVTLADALEVPQPAVEEVLESLVRAKVLVRVAEDGEPTYDPARDVDAVRMVDLEEAVRHDPSAEAQTMRSSLEHTMGPELRTVLRSRHDEALGDSGAITLRQLAGRCEIGIDGVTAASRPSPGAAADGKTPAP